MTTTAIVPAEVRKDVLTAQQQANALKVETPGQAERGSELLRSIKDFKKAMLDRKEEATRPLMKGLASVRDLFKPYESDLADAEKIVKAKLLAFQIEQEEAIEKQQAKITARVERGTMKADTAASKMAEVGEVKKVRGTQMRTLTKVRVMDQTMIPNEYLLPNMPMIVEAVLKQGIEVPGVEKYEEKVLASVS